MKLLANALNITETRPNYKTFEILVNQDAWVLLAVTLVGLVIGVGCTGNIMVILAIKKKKKLQTISNVFVMNLAVCDLLLLGCVLPFNIYTYISDGWYTTSTLCKLVGFWGYTLTGTTIITLTLIAFNRYKLVLDIGAYKQLYTRRNIILMLMVAWLVPAVCLIPALVGIWGQFGYVPMMVTCNLLLDHRSQLFKIFLMVVRAVLPCFLIVYYYARIYHTTRKSHQRIGKIGRNPSSLDVHNHAKEMHMTRMMLIIFLVFSLSYFPCTVTGMIDWNIVLSKQYHMFCQISIYLGSAANPLVYGLMNSQFRQAYRELVCCFNNYLTTYSLTSTKKSSFLNSSNQMKGKSNSRMSSDLQSGIYPLLMVKHCNIDSKPTSEEVSTNNNHDPCMMNDSSMNEKRPTFTLE
ncbi:G-protein coupled receptor moody-like [Mytilus californianus]|uniref:G-protein coupled receptor moody-like n=1 Tax=Mytilus californianus TaxID=6549 RepID=UPI002247F50D|nr:G-protein coupled receptor moody-like [Mytilus californianus]